MDFRDFKQNRPSVGTRILAFSAVYRKGDPMRFRMMTVLDSGMDEVTAYLTERDLEDKVVMDALFAAKS